MDGRPTWTDCDEAVKLEYSNSPEAVDGRPTWTDCDEAGDYVVPNVLSPRDLVSRPDIMDETVPHNTKIYSAKLFSDLHPKCSVMVTHVTIFQYFVQRTKYIGYRK